MQKLTTTADANANLFVALRDPGVMVHAMGKESAARVTLRTVYELEAFAAKVPPMAYDLDSYASLGLLWESLSVEAIELSGSDWAPCVESPVTA